MKSNNEKIKTTKNPEKESTSPIITIKEFIVLLSSYLVVLSGYMFVLGYMSFRGLLNGLGLGNLYLEYPFYFYLVRSIPHAIITYGKLLQTASIISIIFVLLYILYKAITSAYKNIIDNLLPLVLALDIILLTYQTILKAMRNISNIMQVLIMLFYALIIIFFSYLLFRIIRKIINYIVLRNTSDELSRIKLLLPNIFYSLFLGLIIYGIIYLAFEQIVDSYKQGENFAEEYKQSTNLIVEEIEYIDGQTLSFTGESVVLIDAPELIIVQDQQNNYIQIFYKRDIRSMKIKNR